MSIEWKNPFKKKAEETQEDINQRLTIEAIRRVFDTVDGQKLMEFLEDMAFVNEPMPTADTIIFARAEGMRSLVIGLKKLLNTRS